uniref:RING-type domain-containing protein n=1 Tax=Ananas comosus var. bracteatus TaxID=296719 RepID=A0A6V7Q930_ANACO|nr:unnamed protein product [Ananas comosus var. bracteatus]
MGGSWRRFSQRLTSCCGSGGWRHHRRGTPTVLGDGVADDDVPFQEEEEEEEEAEVVEGEGEEVIGATEFGYVVIREAEPAAEDLDQMDLATALAAERQLRASSTATVTSLMRLLEQAGREKKAVKRNKYADGGDDDDDDGGGGGDDEDQDEDEDDDDDDEEGEGGGWGRCCVCMEGRRKRAAFIPCGHTFCRQCARELWLGRGSCPLCNRPVRDVLRIF